MLNPNATDTSKDKSFKRLVDSSKATAKTGQPVLVKNINISEILPTATGFYHYQGSLTTPPCSEKVQWYVMQNPKSITATQLVDLSTLYEGNNRPVKPLGERDVLLVE